jgi:hypothetical protein
MNLLESFGEGSVGKEEPLEKPKKVPISPFIFMCKKW